MEGTLLGAPRPFFPRPMTTLPDPAEVVDLAGAPDLVGVADLQRRVDFARRPTPWPPYTSVGRMHTAA